MRSQQDSRAGIAEAYRTKRKGMGQRRRNNQMSIITPDLRELVSEKHEARFRGVEKLNFQGLM